jgi:glycosyltransferase involved in cell wall biosynthesis
MKKTIIYTINTIKKNGPNVVLENMIKGLDDGYKVYVVSFLDSNDNEAVKKLETYGVSHFGLNYASKKDILRKGARDLQRIINMLNPDVIHSHGIFPDYVSSKVVTSVKRITTIHNLPFEDYRNHFGALLGTFMAKWHISLLKKFDYIIACSETSYNHLKFYTKNENVYFVRNAINSEEHWDLKKEYIRNKIRKQLGLSSKDTVYIFVGSLTKGKNIQLLVDGFKRNHQQDERLIILGTGDELAYCKKNKDDSIILAGFQKNVNEYYFASDIYISASKSEGFSISILEALEAGLYLFLSDIPAHLEVMNVNKHAFIGAAFKASTFDSDLVGFRNRYLKRHDRSNVIAFKNKYFTARRMMQQYKKYYAESR